MNTKRYIDEDVQNLISMLRVICYLEDKSGCIDEVFYCILDELYSNVRIKLKEGKCDEC